MSILSLFLGLLTFCAQAQSPKPASVAPTPDPQVAAPASVAPGPQTAAPASVAPGPQAAAPATPADATASDKFEIVMGNPNAPVIVVMYHSLSCLHCRDFKRDVFPEIKRRFIDTNKISFIMRDLPTDGRSVFALKLAWCHRNPEQYLKMVDLLLKNLPGDGPNKGMIKDWAYTPDKNWRDHLIAIAQEAGLSKDIAERCLVENKDIEDNILADAKKDTDIFQIEFAPSFIINGAKQDGIISVASINKALEVAKKQGLG